MSDLTHDVFISYARKDGAQHAERLERDLQAAGYTTWRDKRDLDEYQDFSAEIEIGIRASRFVAVCVTPSIEQNPSSFVRREILYAQQKDKPIIPLVFPDADLPVLIVHLTWLAFFSGKKPKQSLDYDKGFSDLLERLKRDQEPSSRRPSDDPYREYLERLYESIVELLEPQIFSDINMGGQDTPEAVGKPKKLLMSFFVSAGIEPKFRDKPLKSLKEGYELHKGRLLVLGEPGGGKTTALLTLARDAVVARLVDSTQPLPLLANIPTWDPHVETPLVEWLAKENGIDRNALQQLIDAENTLLLLDALDELGSERTEEVDDPRIKEKINQSFDPRIRFMSQIPANNYVVVSCRIKDYAAIGEKLALNGAVTLEKLTDTQIQDYLKELPDLWRTLQNIPDLLEIVRIPLLLSFFAFAFRDAPEDLKELGDLSHGSLRDTIFRRYVEQRYNHEARKPYPDTPFTLGKTKFILSYVAMMDAAQRTVNPLEDAILANSRYFLHDKAESFVEFSCRLHFLVRSDNNLRFIHLLLRDFFAFDYSIANLNHPWKGIRESAVFALGIIGDKRAVEPVCATLNDSDRLVRLYAAYTLGGIGDERAVQPLIEVLKDEYAYIRDAAARALGRIGDVEAIHSLISALRDVEFRVSMAAADALGQIGEPAIAPLLDDLGNWDETNRGRPFWALAKIGEPAVKPLISLLNHEDKDVQMRAAAALQEIGTPEALEAVARWRAGQEDG
jgi:HEAT repeat protein